MDDKVNKAMTSEEVSVLSNIQSMIQELINMSQPAAEETPVEEPKPEETVGMAIEDKEEREGMQETKKSKVSKDQISTPSDANDTASDDEETRMKEQQSEVTEDNVNEVAKAMALILKNLKGKEVKKSKINPILGALSGITQVVKQLQNNQNETSKCLENILTGLGITEQLNITKSLDERNSNARPISQAENEKAIEYIAKALESIKKDEKKEIKYESQNEKVIKSLNDFNVMTALFDAKK